VKAESKEEKEKSSFSLVKKLKGPFAFLAKMGRREIRGNWAQFLAIIGIGGVAVTLFVGLLANAQSIENRVNEAYDGGNMADLWVTCSSYHKDDLNQIQSIVGDNGEVDTRFEVPGRFARNSIYTVISPEMPSVSKPYEILEQSEDNSSTHFVLVDDSLAHSTDASSSAKFQVGKTFSMSYDISSYISSDQAALLDTIDPTDPAKTRKLFIKDGGSNILSKSAVDLDYTITGIMRYPENVTKASYNTSAFLVDDTTFKTSVYNLLSANYNEAGLKLLYDNAYNSLFHFGDGTVNPSGTLARPNQYLVALKDKSKTAEVKEAISSYFSSKDNLYSLNDRDNMPFVIAMANDVKQARQFTFVFPFVFFFVALLVILTTISQIILKERTQIGTMKALGLSNREIYAHYIGLTLSVVSIGILIGEILGPILMPYFLGQKYDILYTLPARTYVFPVLYGLLTAAFFLAVSALVAFLVCHKEVKLKPAESMRPASPKMKAHLDKIDLKKYQAKVLSFKMAFRNMAIDKVKSFMVVAGVMGCTALLVCGYGIEDTIAYGKKSDMAKGSMDNDAVVTLTFSAGQSEATMKKDLLDRYPLASAFEGMTRSATTAKVKKDNAPESNTNVYILGWGEGKHSHMKWGDDFSNDTIAISEKIADETGAKVGDTLSFTYGATTYEGQLSLIYKTFIFNGVLLHADSPILSSLGEVTFQGCYLDSKSIADKSQLESSTILKGQLVGDYESSGDSYQAEGLSYLIEADTTADWNRQIDDIMSGVHIMTNAVKGFAIILAIIVLYNLALLNFRERTRDIATLKVLGFTKHEIASSLLWETMSLTAVGVIFGMLLGYPFLLAVLKLNTVQLVQYLYHIYPLTYVYSFLLTFIVAFLVNGILSYRTGTVKMVESLKSVE
jgi:ABC-type antimicrobial peptide transport system permease subunit